MTSCSESRDAPGDHYIENEMLTTRLRPRT